MRKPLSLETSIMTKLIRTAVLIWVCGLAAPRVLDAHARLTRAEPAVDGHVTPAPTLLRLWFSEAPEVVFSKVTLTDSTGNDVKLGAIARGDTKLEIRAKIATALSVGRYTVNWRTAGPDGHATSGAFRFTVDAPRRAP
jgi:methionine-rich copper-binding protein CopC